MYQYQSHFPRDRLKCCKDRRELNAAYQYEVRLGLIQRWKTSLIRYF